MGFFLELRLFLNDLAIDYNYIYICFPFISEYGTKVAFLASTRYYTPRPHIVLYHSRHRDVVQSLSSSTQCMQTIIHTVVLFSTELACMCIH